MPRTNDTLELARQAHASAEVLWLRGDREEALARAIRALELTLSVTPTSAALGTQPATLLRQAQGASMDASATDEQSALVLPLLRARRRAERRVLRSIETHAGRHARHVRWAVGAWCLLVALASLALYRPHGPRAHATEVLGRSDFFGAPRAIDGDAKTSWLLPDHRGGALVIELVPARNVRAVRLTQPDFGSTMRATRSARVRLYRGPRAIAQQRVSFLPPTRPGQRLGLRGFMSVAHEREVPLRGLGVTRVEIVVESWRGLGGGLAEVELR